jgi:DNA (cytosine-5)-methyltransferase 1
MNVESDDKVGTLRAEAHGNNPIVLESNQNHATITNDGVCPTLPAAMGMGGGHIPSIVFEPGVATRDGGHIYTDDKAPTLRANPGDNFPTIVSAAGFKGEQGSTARGLGYKEEQSPTLTGNTPAVVYGICSKDSNSMKSDNPNSGFYEADKVRTLDTGGANPNRNQGGNVVVESKPFTEKADCLYSAYATKWNGNGAAYSGALFAQTVPKDAKVYPIEGNGSRPSHKGPGFSDSDKMYTLNTTEQHAVAQVWTTSKASFMTNWTEGQAQTLVATDWKDAPVVVQENESAEACAPTTEEGSTDKM